MSFFAAPAATTATSTTASADKDIEMGDPPTDSISSMAFSPQADYLSVGSWDNSVCSGYLAYTMVCSLSCLTGANIRNWSRRTVAGKGYVSASGPSIECLLEQSGFGVACIVNMIELVNVGGQQNIFWRSG